MKHNIKKKISKINKQKIKFNLILKYIKMIMNFNKKKQNYLEVVPMNNHNIKKKISKNNKQKIKFMIKLN